MDKVTEERKMSLHQAVGRAAESEELADLFFERAGKRYSEGRDREARLLRAMARELQGRASMHRKRQRVLSDALAGSQEPTDD